MLKFSLITKPFNVDMYSMSQLKAQFLDVASLLLNSCKKLANTFTKVFSVWKLIILKREECYKAAQIKKQWNLEIVLALFNYWIDSIIQRRKRLVQLANESSSYIKNTHKLGINCNQVFHIEEFVRVFFVVYFY